MKNRYAGSRLSRRNVLIAGACFGAGAVPRIGIANDFPSRPIRVIVGVTPGGSLDTNARVIGQGLASVLKTAVVVENKPGAAGLLAAEFVSKAPADGYTLMVAPPGPLVIAPQAMQGIRFNVLTDLAAVNMFSTTPIAIAVNERLNATNMKELVTLSRSKPINMGLPLLGSLSHLVVEMTAKATGCNFLNVAYKGAIPALNDTLAGHVDATVSDVGVLIPYHNDKRLRILMVTAEERIKALPTIRTGNEDYPGLVATNWNGLFAPPKTPSAILDRISSAIREVDALPDVQRHFERVSSAAAYHDSAEQFQKFVAAEYVRYGRIIRERDIVISS